MKTIKEFIKEYDGKGSLSEYIRDRVPEDTNFLLSVIVEDSLKHIIESFSDNEIRNLSNWDNILDEYFSYYCTATSHLNIDNCKIVYD